MAVALPLNEVDDDYDFDDDDDAFDDIKYVFISLNKKK